MLHKERAHEELKKKQSLVSDQKIISQARVQQKQEETIAIKIEKAKMIKVEIKDRLEKKENDSKELHLKSSLKVKQGFENFMKIKYEKIETEIKIKTESEKFYELKCRKEEEKTNSLQERIEALVKLEENLVERINHTTQIAKTASDKKTKVVNSRFNDDELLELSFSNDGKA